MSSWYSQHGLQPRRRRRAPRQPARQPQVQRVTSSESKYFTSLRSSVAIPESTDWSGTELDPTTLNTLCAPIEGTDISTRDGRRIEVYKISIRGVISMTSAPDQTDVLSSPATRLILYVDQQTNGAQSQGEQLMEAPSTATAPLSFCSFQSLASLGRFRVLRDKVYRGTVMTAGTDGANTNSIATVNVPFTMTVKFKNPLVMRFNATNGGSVADIIDNSFHLIGQKSSTAYVHTLDYQCRTYYKDA